MNRETFIKEIIGMGFAIEEDKDQINILVSSTGTNLITIYYRGKYEIKSNFNYFKSLVDKDPEKAEKLFDLCVEYSKCSNEERFDKKYIAVRLIEEKYDGLIALKESGKYFVYNPNKYAESVETFKTVFNILEINEIKSRWIAEVDTEDLLITEVPF